MNTVPNATYLNFINLSSEFQLTGIHCYGGFLEIPITSSFLDKIIADNNVHTDLVSIKKFFYSDVGKKIITKEFTRFFIKPVKKSLRRHSIFSIKLLKLLVNVKINSRTKYIEISKKLTSDTTYDDVVLMLSS